jgi:8-oxo-dGTP pyrophosphatase MutT (NUDIX family)
MTSAEKEKITKRDWEDLYEEVCFYKSNKYYSRERKHAREMYQSLDIGDIFDTTESEFEEPEWEFPKGRKYSYETEKECALREFREETNIHHSDLVLLDMTFKEAFIGTNKRKYTNQYYVGVVTQSAIEPYIDPMSRNQVSEIGDVEWLDFEEAKSRIRVFHKRKKEILTELQEFLSSNMDTINRIYLSQ